MLPTFKNEPLTDFSVPQNRAAFEAALNQVKSEIGKRYPLVIGGEQIWTDDVIESTNPSRPDEVLGMFGRADTSHAERAVQCAVEAFESWKRVPAEDRARYLLGAAAEMRRRKHEFSAVMVLEVGKTWPEADADTSEAIDFLEYYARQMLRLADSSHLLTEIAGEDLALEYIGLGVGVIIPPWNFPNAIMTGMTSAAIVAGNTAILKPASQSPWIAYKFCELMWNQGLPSGVLNFMTGPGAVAGSYLVEHPQVRFIAFTGSKEVGLDIYEKSAKVAPGQKWLKRATVLEMGGKDAIIVDESADLEAAAKGIVQSAFGFQGQKCSAGSRAIIVDSVYDQVASRVVELTNKLTIGQPDAQETDLGPVVGPGAYRDILGYIEIGKGEGELLTGGAAVETPEGGYFIAPTVFGEVDGYARIAQEEIFGPVLALVRVRDFDEALEIANSTEYGLTGAVFSRNREHLERAREEFFVGNLYFNRKCTGAYVGAHPFGGFNMSGTDSKAGGPDYLLHFTQAKLIAEKL
jgi:1-pyrroline-5-carboxylate dehydrogenase